MRYVDTSVLLAFLIPEAGSDAADAWMGENHFQIAPVAAYGFVLLMCAIAYTILARALTSHHRENKALADAIGKDTKGWISIAMYVAGIALSLWYPWVGFALYICVAIVWLVPDTRIEQRVAV